MGIREQYFMISSLSCHSSNEFDYDHLTNSEIRVFENIRKQIFHESERKRNGGL